MADLFNVLLEIVFVFLVILDCIITYAVLERGRGVEKKYWQIKWPIKIKLPTLMGFIIKCPAATFTITLLGMALILTLVNLAQAFILLIPVSMVFAWACWKNWGILHG